MARQLSYDFCNGCNVPILCRRTVYDQLRANNYQEQWVKLLNTFWSCSSFDTGIIRHINKLSTKCFLIRDDLLFVFLNTFTKWSNFLLSSQEKNSMTLAVRKQENKRAAVTGGMNYIKNVNNLTSWRENNCDRIMVVTEDTTPPSNTECPDRKFRRMKFHRKEILP